jgi:nucleoside-diphosphate-sugar epimerase
MRVLITGITGFVGSHLADYILENHPEVKLFGLIRWRSPMETENSFQTVPARFIRILEKESLKLGMSLLLIEF